MDISKKLNGQSACVENRKKVYNNKCKIQNKSKQCLVNRHRRRFLQLLETGVKKRVDVYTLIFELFYIKSGFLH